MSLKARIATVFGAAALCTLSWIAAAAAAEVECEPPQPTFDFCELAVGFSDAEGNLATQAGSHPFAQTVTINPFNEIDEEIGKIPSGQPKDLKITLPEGFVGSPDATPQCDSVHFAISVNYAGGAALLPDCPDGSAVGLARPRGAATGGEVGVATPIYNLVPPPGAIARLGFKVPVTGSVLVDITLEQDPPYRAVATSRNITQMNRFYGVDTILWADPGSALHDDDRGVCGAEFNTELGKVNDVGDFLEITCPAAIPPAAFFTLPRSCPGKPMITLFESDSWQGDHAEGSAESAATRGCERVGFSPTISAETTNRSASSPTGLDFDLEIDDPRLTDPDPEAVADSDIKKAVVTLPEGVRINPSQAEGLAVCSEAQFARERADSAFGAGCPAAAKIGTAEAESRLLRGVILRGSVFVATPYENLADDSLIAIYFTLKEPERGINIGLVGKVSPDPRTGQLITTVGNAPHEIPQLPASHFHFHFREGGRSPLITPPACGSYETKALFTPWANPSTPLVTTATFTIDHGVGAGPCPQAGTQPFEPDFEAGTESNHAGAFSPFGLRLTRRDGDQDLTRLSAELAPGMLAKLAGVSKCSDAGIERAKANTGKAELAAPSCPLGSLIGTATGGAGVGSQLTYVTGRIYLAGAYNGAPLSVVAIVPAVAGPFDVGTIVTRFALQIDPVSAEVRVDGDRSDPIPHILEGIPLAVREVRADVDRAGFTLNPTSCDPERIGASIWGGGLDPFSAADDSPVSRQVRFQAAGCRGLGFKPRIGLRLKGGTRRGAFPAFRFRYRPRAKDANLSRLALRFPRSEFIEQGHFRTICTRARFRSGEGNGANCPRRSIYGHVRVYTPLLDGPFRGPVFLRSSNHDLPDVVLALHGPPNFPIEVEVATRIDSVRGGLRAIASSTPDVPVSRVILNMQGGRKGLFVNSTDICRGRHRARIVLRAHNGASRTLRPLLRASCGRRQARASR